MTDKEYLSVSIVDVSGGTEHCSLEFWSDSMANLRLRSSRIGELTSEADDVFEAMCKIRLQLEVCGYFLLCNGARRDAYPSRMSRQMGGKKIYLLKNREPAEAVNLVDIFGAATLDQVCSVAEQKSHFDNWIKSLKMASQPVVHEVTEEVVSAAKANPNGWVYKIEGQFGPDEAVPPHAIVGAWKVDSSGDLTGEFVVNPNYRPGTSKDED